MTGGGAHLPRPVQRLGLRQLAGPRREDRQAQDRPGLRHADPDERRARRAAVRSPRLMPPPISTSRWSPTCCACRRCSILANPFIALGHALLVRRLDFKRQSRIDLVAAGAQRRDRARLRLCRRSASGPWSRRRACSGIARAIGYVVAARLWEIRPRFALRGRRRDAALRHRDGRRSRPAGSCRARPTSSSAAALLDPHRLGIYTTALFLTQILAAKFVPPLNEVAFAAYSRIQARPDMIQTAFLKSVRLIMLVALPFYFGLAVTAEPLVATFLGAEMDRDGAAGADPRHGDADDDAADPVRAGDQRARPAGHGGAHRPGRRGCCCRSPSSPASNGGREGLAWAWLGGMAVLLAATVELSLPVIGISRRALFLRGRAGPRRLGGDGRRWSTAVDLAAARRSARGARLALLVRGRAWRPMPGCCSPSPGRSSTRCSALVRPRAKRPSPPQTL